LPPAQDRVLQRLGGQLAAAADLRGLFGVDFVLRGDRIWTLEVNPRYCASLEVLERAWRFSAVGLHLEACMDRQLPQRWSPSYGALHGKAILFARRAMIVGPGLLSRAARSRSPQRWSPVADIPPVGTHVAPGQPLLTIFQQGPTAHAVIRGLQHRAARVLG
jgi:predicted ATP-grasp superfamily ATP-dependent carboligase